MSVLWRLRKVLGNKEMKLFADGLFMSRIRYCLPVFGIESLRANENEPTSSIIGELQKAQNRVLRIITGRKRSDHVKIADMLETTGFLSINQMLAYSCLMEMWKARSFNVPVLGDLFDRKRQDSRTLRSNTFDIVDSNCEEQLVKKLVKLWNSSTKSFKETNLLVIAKREARTLAKSLPLWFTQILHYPYPFKFKVRKVWPYHHKVTINIPCCTSISYTDAE